VTRSLISAELIAVYRQSNYVVFAEPEFCLNIGKTSTELLALYQQHQVDCAVFISACNPRSEIHSNDENTEKSLALAADLLSLTYPFYPAEGQDPLGIWPSENSFLVLGMPLSAGTELGIQYGQNAILYCGKKALVELVLLRWM
jgi:hypothetical protein